MGFGKWPCRGRFVFQFLKNSGAKCVARTLLFVQVATRHLSPVGRGRAHQRAGEGIGPAVLGSPSPASHFVLSSLSPLGRGDESGARNQTERTGNEKTAAGKVEPARAFLQAHDARRRGGAAGRSLRRDQEALCRKSAAVARVPTRRLPAAPNLLRRCNQMPAARLAAAAERGARARLRSGAKRRAVSPSAGDAHGMVVAPLSAEQFCSCLRGGRGGDGFMFPSPTGGERKTACARRERFGLSSFRGAPIGASPESILTGGMFEPVPRSWWLWIPALVALGRNDGGSGIASRRARQACRQSGKPDFLRPSAIRWAS